MPYATLASMDGLQQTAESVRSLGLRQAYKQFAQTNRQQAPVASDKQQDSNAIRQLPSSGRRVDDEEDQMPLADEKGTGKTKKKDRKVEWVIGADDEEDEAEVD